MSISPRRLSASIFVALGSALSAASCAATPPPAEPVVVVVPPSPSPGAVASSKPEQAEPPAVSEDAELRLINDRLQVVTPDGPQQTVDIEQGGRVVKRVAADLYEEDFYLRDVSKVVYVHEEDWPNPHVARVMIRPGGVTRWHRGEEEWTVSTIMHVSFVFATKEAADDVVDSFRALTRR